MDCPRIDRNPDQQTIFKGNEFGRKTVWTGSLEYDVPGTDHRILKRPDGRYGYVENHDYSKPKLFPAPWYPDGGK